MTDYAAWTENRDTTQAWEAPGLSSIFEPTIILPSQFLHQRDREWSPEKRLMAAVLQDALDCLVRYVDARRGRYRREFVNAHSWLSSDNRDWPFSFVNVCDALGLSVAAVRERILWFLAAHHAETQDAVRHAAA